MSYPSLKQLKTDFINEERAEVKKYHQGSKKLNLSDEKYIVTMKKYCDLLDNYFNSRQTNSKNLELKLQLSNLREYSNELNNLANELQKAIELNSLIQIKTIAKKLISHIKGE
ncbi:MULTISPECIES: hypothetical protein [Campylobacter]|uniref:Uncharacterized protein n=1 Tax=Campylobacter vicugnae TaxID=1660076 RepID=A0ABZ2E7J8_9BACT|nr:MULTISPECIES: hypothetical protein [unclassified Campylobacter]ARR04587.1 hypothetical protein CVIC12175_1489 [Campylobacter sp. RM12175]MCR8690579.1 hypothetical protein [Campylobacter sp. RM9264]MCR8701512.1 hypothetical protein [Campylobacter sp. RM12176]